MQPRWYSRFRWLLERTKEDAVLVRPTVEDVFEHSDWQSNSIVNDPNLDGFQRVELLMLLDSLTGMALKARGGTRQVLTTRLGPTPVRRDLMWSVVRGELVAAS